LQLPVPRIYAHSLDPLNPVGAEYVIEEKAEGKPLGSLWYQWQTGTQLDLVAQLVDFEAKLTSISFRRHGCIYYKKDLEEKGVPAYDLEARPSSSSELGKGPTTEDFALGPLTEAKLWEGERAAMNLDRGPCKPHAPPPPYNGFLLTREGSTPLSYFAAMGINEMQWAKAYARPHTNPYRSLETPESPDEYISLLERYLQLVPHLSPGPSRTTLSHPDLHLDNIFVDPDTKKITCIIDWQSASASELLFQQSIPRLLLPVGSSKTGNQLQAAPEESNESDDANITTDLLSHYQHLTRIKDEPRWAGKALHNCSPLAKPTSLLCGAWSRNDVFSFRHALIYIAAEWGKFAPVTVSCPIQFTKEELELHESELELLEGLGEVLNQLQSDNLIPLGGMVLRENYEQALHISNTVKDMFVNMAESEPQRVLYSRLWPYQDWD